MNQSVYFSTVPLMLVRSYQLQIPVRTNQTGLLVFFFDWLKFFLHSPACNQMAGRDASIDKGMYIVLQVKILQTRVMWDVYVLTGLLADRFTRLASKPADAQTGLADTVDALASKPEWVRNARMKTNDSAGRFVGIHHQLKLSHSIPQPQLLFSAPTDQFHVCESPEFSTKF